jgi:hypothetical protein
MRIPKTAIVFAAAIAVLAGEPAFDSASAQPCDFCGIDGGAGTELLFRSTPQTSTRRRDPGEIEFTSRSRTPALRPSTGWLMPEGSDVPRPTNLRAPRPGAGDPGTTSRPFGRNYRIAPARPMGAPSMRGNFSGMRGRR